MPIYDYTCDKCKLQEEYVLKMEHEAPKCPDCGKGMQQFFSVTPVFHPFREGWYEHIATEPIYIHSKKQLKNECRERGLTSVYAEEM